MSTPVLWSWSISSSESSSWDHHWPWSRTPTEPLLNHCFPPTFTAKLPLGNVCTSRFPTAKLTSKAAANKSRDNDLVILDLLSPVTPHDHTLHTGDVIIIYNNHTRPAADRTPTHARQHSSRPESQPLQKKPYKEQKRVSHVQGEEVGPLTVCQDVTPCPIRLATNHLAMEPCQ